MLNAKDKNLKNKEAIEGIKIHPSYLITFVVAFILGIIFTLILKNYIVGEKINLSTVDLISLVFSVGLSTASIVLAITAIILSKKSEDTIIKRSDESIRHQTQIYDATMNVLQKIESSAGINEKRIDDVSKQIMNLSNISRPGLELKEDRIKDIIREGISSSFTRRVSMRRVPKSDSEQKSEEFKKSIMENLDKVKNLTLIKIGSGDFYTSGEKLVDGIFSIGENKFSISTFYMSGPQKIINFAGQETYKQYFLNLVSEISKGTFKKSFLVFNKNVDDDKKFMGLFKDTLSVLNKNIAKKIVLISGSVEQISKKIIKNISIKKPATNR